MITCYFGKLGQGKTYGLAQHAWKELESGRIVYSNFFLDWQGKPEKRMGKRVIRKAIPKSNFRAFKSVTEFMTMENAFVALDEGWIYFDSYSLTKFPIEIRMKILQSRKDGLDIAYTSQRPEQVHVSLRAMTNEYYECIAGNYPFLPYPVFFRYEADLVNGVIKREATVKMVEKRTRDGSQWIEQVVEKKPKIIWPSKKVFNSFDTTEKIALPTTAKSLRHAPKPLQDIKAKHAKE